MTIDDLADPDGSEGVYVELDHVGSGRIRRVLLRAIAALASPGVGGAGGGLWIYGDGSDGELVLHDGDFWLPGFYTDVTIEAGANVKVSAAAALWPVFRCTGTFTILGTLDLSGEDAVGLASGEGGGGGEQTDGVQAPNSFLGLSSTSGVPRGGAGGDGSSGSGGSQASPVYPFAGLGPRSGRLPESIVSPPFGGGGGGGDETNYGGGGGGRGNWAQIIARHVVHGADNLYNLQGGNGAPGGDDGSGATGNGDCGGGGGGGAGYWVTLSDDLAGPDANIVGGGGTGGAGCGTGTDGTDGEDGFVVHLLNA